MDLGLKLPAQRSESSKIQVGGELIQGLSFLSWVAPAVCLPELFWLFFFLTSKSIEGCIGTWVGGSNTVNANIQFGTHHASNEQVYMEKVVFKGGCRDGGMGVTPLSRWKLGFGERET